MGGGGGGLMTFFRHQLVLQRGSSGLFLRKAIILWGPTFSRGEGGPNANFYRNLLNL